MKRASIIPRGLPTSVPALRPSRANGGPDSGRLFKPRASGPALCNPLRLDGDGLVHGL